MHTEAECCSQTLPSWDLQRQYAAYIYILWLNEICQKCRNGGPTSPKDFVLSSFVQSGWKWLPKHALPLWTCKFSWQYISLSFQKMGQWVWNLLEDTRGAQCLTTIAQFVELPRANNVIHKSSPTSLLTKHANELITLSQLMNLVARGSVALSSRLVTRPATWWRAEPAGEVEPGSRPSESKFPVTFQA